MRKEYMIFQNMLNCYQKVDLNAKCDAECNISFFFLARTLAEMDVRNPFSFGEKGFSEYDDMMFFFQKWNKTKKTCAFKQRFLMAAYDLCDAVKENIFDKEDPVEVVSLDEMKEKELNKFFGVTEDPTSNFDIPVDNTDLSELITDNEAMPNEVDEINNTDEINDVDEVHKVDEVKDDNEVNEVTDVDETNEVDEISNTDEPIPYLVINVDEVDEPSSDEADKINKTVVEPKPEKIGFFKRFKNMFTGKKNN